MVINGFTLFLRQPIRHMLGHKIYEHGVSSGMSEAGYDIRIKQEITFTRDLFLKRCIIINEPGLTLTEEGPALIATRREKGIFVLASALEEFEMPEDMMGIVHDKSSWARRGLSVLNTCVEPGWKGFLTLELVYHGWRDLHIPAGSGIAQVIFHQVTDLRTYQGRYQDQADRPVEAIDSSRQAVLL